MIFLCFNKLFQCVHLKILEILVFLINRYCLSICCTHFQLLREKLKKRKNIFQSEVLTELDSASLPRIVASCFCKLDLDVYVAGSSSTRLSFICITLFSLEDSTACFTIQNKRNLLLSCVSLRSWFRIC